MRVRLICEDNAWIFAKFANKMNVALLEMGIHSDVSDKPDYSYDINHYIHYAAYRNPHFGSIQTLMITHIDNIDKLKLIEKQLESANVGVCMSRQTYEYLIKLGFNSDKLTYINPAHDGVIKVRKIVLGFACRVQDDGRKRETFLNRLSSVLNPKFIEFKIMGDGWETQVDILESKGFNVDYIDHFDYDLYQQFIPCLDYYMYMGMDEGQMGFVDALAAGIKTIVTNQGYHLDACNGITHGFINYEELEAILLKIQKNKEALVNAVSTWNWTDYTLKHVEIWRYLLGDSNVESSFVDGLNVLSEQIAVFKDDLYRKKEELILIEMRNQHIINSRKKKMNFLMNPLNLIDSILKVLTNPMRIVRFINRKMQPTHKKRDGAFDKGVGI